MMTRRALVVALVTLLLVTAVQPARAEAFEPTTIILIASAAVVVVVVVAYLIIANVQEHRRAHPAAIQAPDGRAVVVLASRQAAIESP